MSSDLSSGDKNLQHHDDDMGHGAGNHEAQRAQVRKPAPDFKGQAYWDKKF